jgi:NADPH:quinone reductase and related Zn-dependent oxidoreductases
VSYAEAAALADATALCFLRDKAGLRSGQAVLVNGASGAVGSAAVQLAAHFGATVTGVCSGPHLRLAASWAPNPSSTTPGRISPAPDAATT